MALAVVVAGGVTAPAYLEPAGQVIVLPPVASCFATTVKLNARPLGELENVKVTLPVSVRLKKLLDERSRVVAPVDAALVVTNSEYALRAGATI
jgi:hypothetical protein